MIKKLIALLRKWLSTNKRSLSVGLTEKKSSYNNRGHKKRAGYWPRQKKRMISHLLSSESKRLTLTQLNQKAGIYKGHVDNLLSRYPDTFVRIKEGKATYISLK